jgi:Relaxase/Mobilisation nuclease domain
VIISGRSRSNWRFFATHLTRADTNERVAITEMRGVLSDNVLDAFREMHAVAGGTNCKNFFYHANLNPRADEQLSPEQWHEAVDLLERHLELKGHARFVVQHEKNGRTHEHVIWLRIDPDTMTAVSDSHNYRRHELAAREIEQAFGLAPVESALTRDKGTEARGERGPENWETFRGFESGIDPRLVKAEITALWQSADSGLAFKAALEEQGYILAKGDRRDFCVIDRTGDEHSLARRISGAKAAEIRARMGDIDRDALPTVAEARAMALEAAGGGGAPFSPLTESEATSAPTAVPAAEAEEARQFGPPPELTPEVTRELAARFGDERHEGLVPDEPGTRDGLTEEKAGERSGLTEEKLGSRDGLTAEPLDTAEPGEPRRASSWGYAWRAFSDRARAFSVLLHEVWHDETSGTPEAERGLAARLLDTGRELLTGLRGRNAATFAQGVEDAADLAHDLAASPDGEGEPKSWLERMRERAGQIWRNERGAVPDFEVGDALWEALQESGPEGDEIAQEEPPEPDMPEPDGPDLGLD